MTGPLLDVDQMAKVLGVKKSWIYAHSRLKGDDQIPHLKVGKYIRMKPDAVMEWLEKKGEAA